MNDLPTMMEEKHESITKAMTQAAASAGLSFAAFRRANVERCEKSWHMCNDWTPTDWATAMAGECGEACNLIKKLRRLGCTPEEIVAAHFTGPSMMAKARVEIGDELADLVTYADLLAQRLGIDLGEAVVRKFNKVSLRVDSDVRL